MRRTGRRRLRKPSSLTSWSRVTTAASPFCAASIHASRRVASAVEARRFAEAAKKATPQLSAFSLLALDSGAPKSELHGLLWTDVDLDAATVIFQRQLDAAGTEPKFGATKTGRSRTVTIGAETVAQLKGTGRRRTS
jgi:integrase